MPRTKISGAENPQLQLNMYMAEVVMALKDERADWDSGFKTESKKEEKVYQANLDYIGADLTDEQFATLEERLKNDEKTADLFRIICREVSSNTITKNREVFQKALMGEALGLKEEEAKDAFEKASQICTKDQSVKRQKKEKCEAKAQRVKNEERHIISQGTMALADGAYDEKKTVDPFADDQKQKDRYTEIAAMILANYKVSADREFPSASNYGYDYNAIVSDFADRKSWKSEIVKDLKNDKDFAAFVQEYRAQGKEAARFKPEYIAKGWETYKEELKAEKEKYLGFLNSYKNLHKNSAIDEPYLMFPMKDVVDDDFSKEDIKQKCKDLLDKNNTEAGVSKKDFIKAANLIVADTLLSPAFDKTFYDSDKVKSNGVSNIVKLNIAISEMREQIINDPIFENVLNSRPSHKNIVSRYKEAVRKEVNRKIHNEQAEKEAVKGNASLEGQHKKFAENNTVNISDEEFKLIRETRENLQKYNEGKKPSDHMKRLTDALDAVISQKNEGADPKVNALEELNSAALNYYNKRQGMIFSPVTDNGKARLSAVEKLTFTTDKIAERCKSAFAQSRTVADNGKQMGK